MAERIKGITVRIGGDTTGLSKALSGTNKQISETQKQLKDVERLLKLDPKNTELLEQKQRLLSQAVGETKGKLDSLKDAQKQVQAQFDSGEITKEQYEGLQREIASTELQLKNLEKAAKESDSALSKISKTADKVASGADKVANKTKKLSLAATGVVTGLVAMSVKAGKSADDINTLAKQTGLTTEQIQKFQYASDIIDVDLDTLTGSLAKLTKNMQSAKQGSKNTKAAFDSLGVSILDNSGNLRSNDDVFNEVIQKLSKMKNETQRDALAMQIFGKSAQNLNPLILGGADALKELGQEAEDAGLILSQDALDSANEFNDAIDKFKATASGTFAEVGTEVVKLLNPFIEDLATILKDVLSWIRGLDESQIKMIGTVLMVVAAISPMAKIIGGISSAISGVTKSLQFLMANPMVAIIAAIVGLVLLIATKGDEIQAVLQKVDDFLQNIFAKDWTDIFGPVLGGALNGLFDTIQGIWNGSKRTFDGIIDFIRGVFTGDWERAWNGVKDIFGGIWDTLVEIVKAPINAIIWLINCAIDGINWIIDGINCISFDVPDWLGGGHVGFDIGSIDQIPYLAKGGVLSQGSAVVGEAGPELLTVMGNRTIVEPLTQNTSTANVGGATIYVYGAPGQDVNELADILMNRMGTVYQMKGAVWAK